MHCFHLQCLLFRQRKDELEQRMSALQESRRELMVQLEGLMKLLKVKCSSTLLSKIDKIDKIAIKKEGSTMLLWYHHFRSTHSTDR